MKRLTVTMMLLVLVAAPAAARAQSPRPPLGCFAYVQFQDDLPADTIRTDLGYGLWLGDGTIVFGSGSDGSLAFVLPDGTQHSAKPVAFSGAGTNAWLGYVGDPVTVTCGDNQVFIPTSKINWGS
jgi:hypothetical protein